jgi:hypothetical protein
MSNGMCKRIDTVEDPLVAHFEITCELNYDKNNDLYMIMNRDLFYHNNSQLTLSIPKINILFFLMPFIYFKKKKKKKEKKKKKRNQK